VRICGDVSSLFRGGVDLDLQFVRPGQAQRQLFLISRPPVLILIAAPFSSRLSRYTAPRTGTSQTRRDASTQCRRLRPAVRRVAPKMPFSDSENGRRSVVRCRAGGGGVAPRGQIAPVEAPESFRARPSRSSARDGSNAPFYCAIIHGLSGLARLHDRDDVLAQKQDQRTTLGNGTAFSAVAPS
jgi:hypothetical protein